MKDLLLKLSLLALLSGLLLLESCKSYNPDSLMTSTQEKKVIPWKVGLTMQETGAYLFELQGPELADSMIIGEAFDREDGTWIVHLDELHWFYNHPLGWSDTALTLWGTLVLYQEGNQWTITVEEEPWIEGVSRAEIRYRDPITSGDQGRDRMQRRWSRIETLNSHWQERLPESHYGLFNRDRNQPESPWFTRDYRSLLFPELYGYPDHWQPKDEDPMVRAEDILWDQRYTQDLLPEEWQELRDSGTLLRDYEEAASLIWIAYNWQWLWTEELPGLTFTMMDSEE